MGAAGHVPLCGAEHSAAVSSPASRVTHPSLCQADRCGKARCKLESWHDAEVVLPLFVSTATHCPGLPPPMGLPVQLSLTSCPVESWDQEDA